MHAVAGGLRLRFAEPLDKEVAEDGDSWAAEQWNYKYAAGYGSKEYSSNVDGIEGHDAVAVKSVKLSDDGCTVFVAMPALRHRNLRGIYMRVIEAGEIAVGDVTEVIARPQR